MAAVPSGSYLALWNGTEGEAIIETNATYAETGAVPYIPRSIEQIGQCFEGLQMVNPGLVCITQWRPATFTVGRIEPINACGAVARKP